MPELHLEGGDWHFEDERIAALIASILDLRPFWPMVTPLFVKWMGEQFKTEGAWGLGTRWAPLSPAYEAWKQRHYPGRGILVARGGRPPGLLYAATSPRTSFYPQRAVFAIDKWRSSGGDILDPGWHQEGNTQGMPARPIIPPILPRAADDDISRAAESYLEERVRSLGL